ncbi:MAG TPA: branched-chain amino acid ABC transporter ATP-binding protein/permease [Stellaceae bacterium]|nr:branched-chain amino acid ABC transporter ATP-binding protein/permease [Stellaceae bacterium]
MTVPRAAGAARFLPEFGVAVGLVAMPYALPHLGGTLDLAQRILDWGLFGLGFDILFGFTGLLAFGQAAFFGTGGFTAAYFLTAPFTANTLLALAAGTAVAAALGMVIGLLSLRRAGIYFAMLTLAFGEMAYFLEISPLATWTGGENGIAGVPAPHLAFGPFAFDVTTPQGMYWLIAVLFFIGFWLAHRIVRSPVGTVLRAIRDNEGRARAVGHDVAKYKLMAFVVAAAYGGLAGGLLGLLQGYMPPDAFYLDTSGQLVVQTVIGGAGTLIGPLVGAAVWLYLYTALQQVAGIGALWKLLLGVIFVVLVTVLPRGIAGGVVMLWRAIRRDRRAAAPGPVAAIAAIAEPVVERVRAPLDGPVVLRAEGLSKHYDGVIAVDDVSFELVEGEVRAVIGPNGAGKSTFFNMLAGVLDATAGEVWFRGHRLAGLDAARVCQLGIAKSFQINQLFLGLSVHDNVLIAALARRYGKFHPAMLRDVRRVAGLDALVAETLAAVQLGDRAAMPASALAYGEKRRLEIGLALATRPQVLLLDEPMAGMSPSERADTMRLVKRIAEGISIVIVEHDMDVVFELADRITVLYNGRKIAEDTPEAIQADPQVRAAYLGSPVDHEPARA